MIYMRDVFISYTTTLNPARLVSGWTQFLQVANVDSKITRGWGC